MEAKFLTEEEPIFLGQSVWTVADSSMLVCSGPGIVAHSDGSPTPSKVMQQGCRRMGKGANIRGKVTVGPGLGNKLLPQGGRGVACSGSSD
jgi:hypothetical protein